MTSLVFHRSSDHTGDDGWNPFGENESAYEHSMDYGNVDFNGSFGNSIISRFVQYSISGITIITIFMLIGFGIIGLAWSAVFERTRFGEVLETIDIPGAFAIVNIVIAFVYSDWLNRAVREFTSLPKQYVQLVDSTRKIASKVAVYSSAICTDISQNKEGMRLLDQLFDLMRAFNYVLPHVFSSALEHEKRPYSNETHNLVSEYMRNKTDVVEFLYSCTQEISRDVVLLHQSGLLNARGEQEIMDELDKQIEFLDSLRSSALVKQPEIFNFHLSLIFGIYLFFVVPMQLYNQTGKWLPLMYPFIMFLFVGMIVYRWYLGGAFESNGLFSGFKPEVIRGGLNLYLEEKKLYVMKRNFYMSNKSSLCQ